MSEEPVKKLTINYEALSKLSLADEIALLEYIGGIMDQMMDKITVLQLTQSKRPLDIKENAEYRGLSQQYDELHQIASVLNNRTSNVINSIFGFSTEQVLKTPPQEG